MGEVKKYVHKIDLNVVNCKLVAFKCLTRIGGLPRISLPTALMGFS